MDSKHRLCFLSRKDEDIRIFTSDNREMAVKPSTNNDGDLVLDLLPRARYRLRVEPRRAKDFDLAVSGHYLLTQGLIILPYGDGDIESQEFITSVVAMNVSDKLGHLIGREDSGNRENVAACDPPPRSRLSHYNLAGVTKN